MTANDRKRPARQEDQEILAGLREAKKQTPELAEVIDLQLDLFKVQMQVHVDLTAPQYSAEEVLARFGKGTPLLRAQELTLEWETFSNLYRNVCQISAQHRADLSVQFERLLKLIDDDPTQVRKIVKAWLKSGNLADYYEKENESTELLTFVFTHALRPFLRAYASLLAPLIEQERWLRGRCPVCGGEPDLAFLDEESGARHLVCSRCDSQWLFPRVRCPFCNSSEPRDIAYYPSEDGRHRLYTCQGCKRYLKTVDLRKARRRVQLPVERIVTVALDVAAREEGYH